MNDTTTSPAGLGARLRERLSTEAINDAMAWLQRNLARVQALTSQPLLRDFVLEPFTSVFDTSGTVTDRHVYKLITQVALMNAVMAAVPGSMGLGVTVAIGLELFMAFRIAQLLGFRVHSPMEILKSFTVGVGAVLGALYLFRAIWGLAFSLFAFVPGVGSMTTFAASYFTTLVLGVVYWIAFEELRKSNETLEAIGNREWKDAFGASVKRARGTIAGIASHQFRLLRGLVNPRTVSVVGERIRAYLSGELVADTPRVRGDLFVPLAMAALISRQTERLDGPMGTMFLDSVRQAHPKLAGASLDEMVAYFGRYDDVQLGGILATLRGQMFERMVEAAENADGDVWIAALHDDRNVPGSDLIITDEVTGETIEISLKATDSTVYLEEALRRYPDIPLVTTDEVAGVLDHHPMVSASGINNAEVRTITKENFDEMLEETPSLEAGIGAGIAFSTSMALYPFLIARGRGRIDGAQLTRAVQRVTGEAGQKLIIRLSFAAMLGPIFGWYLLARGGGAAVNLVEGIADETQHETKRTRRLVLRTSDYHRQIVAQ